MEELGFIVHILELDVIRKDTFFVPLTLTFTVRKQGKEDRILKEFLCELV
jgi:hypothetical protein